jgi:hypothetical protein
MSTEKQISAVLSAAGNFICSLPIIEEINENGNKTYHCQWQHEKGIVLCKSVGGQSHTRYVWEFKPTIQ